MGRYKKCIICDESIIGEQGVPYKGRYAHQKCFNIAVKALQKNKIEQIDEIIKKKKEKNIKKPKAELKEDLSEEEYKKKKQYYEYLRGIVNENELNAKIYALTEDYIKRYNFTYENMHKTLIYLKEIVEKDLTGDVVGIIPYYYSEAMRYYETVNNVAQHNENIDISKMYKEKTIVVQPKQRKIKQIDIESIRKEVD